MRAKVQRRQKGKGMKVQVIEEGSGGEEQGADKLVTNTTLGLASSPPNIYHKECVAPEGGRLMDSIMSAASPPAASLKGD